MNTIYRYFVVEADGFLDNCMACQQELAEVGPLHGPERPPHRVSRWSMTPEEWAGGGLAVQNSPF